ncbi:MAG: peptide deformylase [Oscillospiraceae bacterium]|nr:peptide deformylase [Oscillospiraceae bacterium]
MALREIIKFGDDMLRKKCREVTKFDDKLATLLDDMAETLKSADGVGLAAPQVGILRRVCIVDVRDEHGLVELINPEILEKSGSQTGNEGCLSAPGEWCEVVRPAMVKVKAFDRHGNEFTLTASELMARAVCHEVDHLDGVLFIDRVEKTIPQKS